MNREQLKGIWQTADWKKVIDIFGLEIDKDRHSKHNEIWIKSPFTNEKKASLHINLTHNIFKDFSSGKGSQAGILNFCQDLLALRGKKMNCYEVAQWMINKGICGNTHDSKGYNPKIKNKWHKIRDEKEKKVPIRNPEQNKPIHTDLRPWLEHNHPELKSRGITSATCKYLGCGFLPQRKNGTKHSPLNGRLVFQIRGIKEDGRTLTPVILSHTGRALSLDQETRYGKFWGFPFHKGLEIYNQDNLLLDPKAKRQIEHYGLVLVEGFFDVAALINAGCLNVCALMGAHITESQIGRLKFIHSHIKIPKITLFLDRDRAGVIGTEKAFFMLKDNGFFVKTFDWNQSFTCKGNYLVKIPQKIKDPADMSAEQVKWLREMNII